MVLDLIILFNSTKMRSFDMISNREDMFLIEVKVSSSILELKLACESDGTHHT